ncbi:M50 family metallopeptidase [Salibacterium aidingense]|uniref:M50 family metallopeptidase n=1 Tax=Salibacterium aidingense TaxID=384933 RepID=UPI00041CF179|nr:M50 family metallopeptidase [Salibacterium aidingense]
MEIFLSLLAVAAAAAVLYLPVIGTYLSTFHTLVHECGHAAAALLTGGHVSSISLFSSREGAAGTRHHKPGLLITSLAGYPFASIVSVLFIYGLSLDWFAGLGLCLLGLLLFSLFFWIRNPFGVFWVLSLLGGGLLVWYYEWFQVLETVLSAGGLVLLVQAFISCWHVFLLSFRRPEQAGDASILARITFIPTPIWGIFFLGQGIVFFGWGLLLWTGVPVSDLTTWL